MRSVLVEKPVHDDRLHSRNLPLYSKLLAETGDLHLVPQQVLSTTVVPVQSTESAFGYTARAAPGSTPDAEAETLEAYLRKFPLPLEDKRQVQSVYTGTASLELSPRQSGPHGQGNA